MDRYEEEKSRISNVHNLAANYQNQPQGDLREQYYPNIAARPIPPQMQPMPQPMPEIMPRQYYRPRAITNEDLYKTLKKGFRGIRAMIGYTLVFQVATIAIFILLYSGYI